MDIRATVFKSVGMAVEDIVAAQVVFERVRAQFGERSSK
jgi:ornithine cyclodeaminase/alanine dehydrogenase-like protein (mu-crystallin family)